MSSSFREHPLRVGLPQLRVLHPTTCPAGTYGTWGSAGPGQHLPLIESGINEMLKAVWFTPACWQTAGVTKGVWEEHHDYRWEKEQGKGWSPSEHAFWPKSSTVNILPNAIILLLQIKHGMMILHEMQNCDVRNKDRKNITKNRRNS